MGLKLDLTFLLECMPTSHVRHTIKLVFCKEERGVDLEHHHVNDLKVILSSKSSLHAGFGYLLQFLSYL